MIFLIIQLVRRLKSRRATEAQQTATYR